jgi:uncharacterized membrane protein YoaK (UPF0700 family)
LFTDLGIELSQLFFHKKEEHRSLLWNSIKLRLTIILFFFAGGVIGGYLYQSIQAKTLLLASGILTFALMFDIFRKQYYRIKRKI